MIALLRRAFRFARPYAGRYVVGCVCLLATNALLLTIPWLLRDAVHAIEHGEAAARVTRDALWIAVVAVVQAAIRTLSRLLMLGASREIVFDLRERLFAALQRLGAGWYDRHRTGDIMSRSINDLVLLRSLYGPGILNLLNTAIVYVATLTLLVTLNPTLTLIALGLYPPLLLAVNRINRHSYARSVAVQEQLGELSNRAQETIAGIQQVKTYAQEEREVEGFRELCDEFRRRTLAMVRAQGGMMSLIGVGTGFATLIVLFVGGRQVIAGRMTLADFVAFNAYLVQLSWPTVALGWIINVYQRGAGAMERVAEVLDAPPDPLLATAPPPAARPTGAVAIRDLTFRFPGDEDAVRPVLDRISLDVPAGARVALVGEVGAGKSTVLQILAGIYPPPRGSVFYGGTDIHDLGAAERRSLVAFVPQDAFLFSRSVRENITLGRADITDEDLAEVVRNAHLTRDIAEFPAGLDTVLGERGYTVSGGQRQRIALARALVAAPQLLLLDDPLAAVDADTERAILARLDAVMQGRTLLLVTHRPATLALVETIIVFEHGRIVESGTHDALLAGGGLYPRLFQRELERERALRELEGS